MENIIVLLIILTIAIALIRKHHLRVQKDVIATNVTHEYYVASKELQEYIQKIENSDANLSYQVPASLKELNNYIGSEYGENSAYITLRYRFFEACVAFLENHRFCDEKDRLTSILNYVDKDDPLTQRILRLIFEPVEEI